ncbi:spermidine synthase-like protein [Burkholderiales bacterium GJ-E10]|nr:spermidine synthase-like protein [Burkholderiales bacterium GJ-E10]
MNATAALLYFLSGATGLCYEVLWARMLSAQFGASTFGIAATVTAFLLGLGIGSLAAARVRGATPRTALRAFAVLEGTVALYALALPAIVAHGAPHLESLAPILDFGEWSALQGAIAVILLGLPAAAMGASFPMIVRALPAAPATLGRIYGVNCLGAALGALGSLFLLESLGWADALYAVAAVSMTVAAGAWMLAGTGAQRESSGDDRHPSAAQQRPVRLRDQFTYAAVGAAALLLELGWTRLYGMVMLRTEYVLAIVLAVYLLGTAIGSLIAARAVANPAATVWLARLVPLAAASGILAGLWGLPAFSLWIQRAHFSSLHQALALQALALCAWMLPTTAALGAWLPLLARRSEGGNAFPPSAQRDARTAAALYGANSLGAAIGAAFTVAVAIPAIGTTACVALAAILLLGLGAQLGAPRTALAAIPFAALAAWPVHRFPAPARMLSDPAMVARERYRYEDALTFNQVAEGTDGQRVLLTDLQHMDASSDPAAVRIQADQARLPLLLHPAPRSILFLGLGTGISASGSLPYPDLDRTAVEISPGAIHAARTWFAPVNGGVMDRMRVVHDDARHFLAAQTRRYDVIVGDLFHPDLAGMSNLLSVEQFRRARDHLTPDGVFAQWIALNQFDLPSLQTVLRSFRVAFPDAQLFVDGMHMALVGTLRPLRDAPAMTANLAALAAREPAGAEAATGGEGATTWLGRYWGPITAAIAPPGGPVQSESRPVIEYRLPRLRYAQQPPLADVLRALLRRRPSATTAAAALDIPPAAHQEFLAAYAGVGYVTRSWIAAIAGDTPAQDRDTHQAYDANPHDRWVAEAVADEMLAVLEENAVVPAPDAGAAAQPAFDRIRVQLDRILQVDPDNVATLRALWHLERASGHPAAARTAFARLRRVAPLDLEVRSTLKK